MPAGVVTAHSHIMLEAAAWACLLGLSVHRVGPEWGPNLQEPLVCGSCSCAARALPKSGPASWPAKCHFGTIGVSGGEHPSLTHTYKPISPLVCGRIHPTLVPVKTETFFAHRTCGARVVT